MVPFILFLVNNFADKGLQTVLYLVVLVPGRRSLIIIVRGGNDALAVGIMSLTTTVVRSAVRVSTMMPLPLDYSTILSYRESCSRCVASIYFLPAPNVVCAYRSSI